MHTQAQNTENVSHKYKQKHNKVYFVFIQFASAE